MKIFSFFSKKVLIGLGVLVVVVGLGFAAFGGENGKQTVAVSRADIIQEVASTGKVKPTQDVELGFNQSGRVQNVYAKVGDTVKAGAVIAVLEAGEATADLRKAEAVLLEETIKLREVKNTAPVSYSDASKNLSSAIREGFAKADNSVRNKADQFFKNIPENPRFEISITSGGSVHYFPVSTSLALEINNLRRQVEVVLKDWEKRNLAINSSTDLVVEADKAIDSLNKISVFLDKVAEAVNGFAPADFTYETTVSNYKTTVSSARTDVSAAVSDVVTAKDKVTAAPLLGSTGQFESVLSQEAKVAQAQAAVSALQASLSKSVIRAPFDGVVTLQDAKVGAAVSAGTALVSVVSPQDQIFIEANISEINIGKVTVGNPVSITLDAFPNESFSGQVAYIEPGEVVIDGVVNYKVRVVLNGADARLKNGLTANLKIETAKITNVLSLPLYAVSQSGEEVSVNKRVGSEVQKTSVQLGLRGNDGLVEVLNGLNEGDIVEF